MSLRIRHGIVGFIFPVVFLVFLFSFPSNAKILCYQFNITEKTVNFSGNVVRGLSINNSIPGPTIKAVVGDILRVTVTNHLREETSIHWHGVLVPNRMDGVPYITSPPIEPGQSFTYEFPVKQSGTYWYHAHSGLQEQQGLYGPLIFYPESDTKDYDEEHVIVLSDWSDEKPEDILSHLKQDPDYYALKKDSVQSWDKVLMNGSEALQFRIKNALSRMGTMDLSDIGYDAFLINGKKVSLLSHAKVGTRVKLRIINAAASSYFILVYSGGSMKVIEADGRPLTPFTTGKIKIAMAETYDVIVTVPENKTYELRASSEDGTGFAVAHIGKGALVPVSPLPMPNLVLMDHGSHKMNHNTMQESTHSPKQHDTHQTPAPHHISPMHHASHASMSTSHTPSPEATISLPHVDFLNNYQSFKSQNITALPKANPLRTFTLRLTGSMERYVWTVNDTPMYAADKIVIKKGENVRFILVNETMMDHPIHLHGHFFRILNGQGDYSPLKHTVSVAPFETIEIEFEANEEKDWIFHCHNLYHMKLGMGGIIHYEGTQPDSDVIHHGDHSKEHGNQWFNAFKIEGYTNLVDATTLFVRNNDNITFNARHNYKKDYEVDITYGRYVSQFLAFYAGTNFKREDEQRGNTGILGIEYLLPLLVKADLRINTKGKMRFGLRNEHQLTDRTSFEWKWNTDKEYTAGLNYAVTKQCYISGNYDSRERFGAGLTVKF